ncbi:MAG: ComF family protein [Nitrospinae bacterium]|nr:ComF family protein [Nitrospinota bacterium]
MAISGLWRQALAPVWRLFPPRCVSCGGQELSTLCPELCDACLRDIEYPPHNICSTCAKPLEFEYELETLETYQCGECLENPPKYEKLRFGLMYGGPAREMIHAFKFSARPYLWKSLAKLGEERLAPFFVETPGAVVVPVPLHPWKLFKRGYNPAYLLARHYADMAGLAMADGALKRVRNTRHQYGLTIKERAENVRGVFILRDARKLKGRTVILFDDIHTTGATVNECVKAILKAKPESVRVATLLWAR